jgi:hypothetical protein
MLKAAGMLLGACALLISGAARGDQPDKTRYIGIDEIKPGMEAYCLTVFEGTKIEKFPLEVVSVVHNITPHRNAILVRGLDERFKHVGPVAGCSGSPVYIDGRMAGALAFGWSFSKDPLYGVTPIAEMLAVGQGKYKDEQASSIKLDFSQPLDMDAIWKAAITPTPNRLSTAGEKQLAIPLSVSLPEYAVDKLQTTLGPLGFEALAGGGMGDAGTAAKTPLEPGSALAVPLVTGDVTMSAVGTVTEVADGKFYAFGHSMLGYGGVELPVGPAYIHTIVASLNSSFKLGDAMEVTGTLMRDEQSGIYGIIGKTPSMIDMHVTVERYNDPVKRVYNCKVARNDQLTPALVNAVLSGASSYKGEMPPEHTVRYEATIKATGLPPIKASNTSTDSDIMDLAREVVAPTTILMNNAYRKAHIESIDVSIYISNKSTSGAIRSLDVSRTRVKPGETFQAGVTLQSFRAGSTRHTWQVTLPKDVSAGTYKLSAMGADAYIKFLLQAAPQKFTATSFEGAMALINNVLAIRRDRIYSVLLLQPGGLTIERTTMPDLPDGKAAVLADPSRALRVLPYQHWVEQQIPVEAVPSESKSIEITVEEP